LALLQAAIKIIDGLLFGGYGDVGVFLTGEVGGERVPAPGLLTPWGQYPEDRSVTEEESVDDSPTLATLSVVESAPTATVKTVLTTEVVEGQELSGQTEIETTPTTEKAVVSPPLSESGITTTEDVTEETTTASPATASPDAKDPDPGATAVTGPDREGNAENSKATQRTRTKELAGKEVGEGDKPTADTFRKPTATRERNRASDNDREPTAAKERKASADKERKRANDNDK